VARTTLGANHPTSGGVIPAWTAANADGHSFPYSKSAMLYAKNASGGSINVTVQTPGTADGLSLPDKVVAIGAGAEKVIGDLPEIYKQADGTVLVDFSAVTSVTVALFDL
jgi:hypothetical protein